MYPCILLYSANICLERYKKAKEYRKRKNKNLENLGIEVKKIGALNSVMVAPHIFIILESIC